MASLTDRNLTDRNFRVQTLQIDTLWRWLQSGELLPLPPSEPYPDLVETFMLYIPCAPALLHEDKDGKLTSVGNPTMEAVLAFIRGDFKVPYEGKAMSYLELPLHFRSNFTRLPIQAVITEPTCSQEVREEIEVRMGRRSREGQGCSGPVPLALR